ncbi:hypothetical protein ElyMa_001953700 [Elysia marginata]|uniref:Secreted protein n=1 Tax=Elysia marginata TaxID=1093978 RepID=A0AAV4EYT9_9GAST|nr:hypothetical protein ElyMa_001953700 [Elysia marginata]
MRKPYCLCCSEATCCSRVTMYTFIRRACSDAIYLAAPTRRQPATSGTINTPYDSYNIRRCWESNPQPPDYDFDALTMIATRSCSTKRWKKTK